MHARLVHDDVREIGQAVLDILDAAGAHDVFALGIVGLPEGRLVDPIGLLLQALAKAKTLEHFHRTAGDAVGVAELQRPVALVNDAGGDVGEGRELRGEREAGGTAADDQNIDFRRRLVGRRGMGGGRRQFGIAVLIAIQVKLHARPPGMLLAPRGRYAACAAY